MSNNNLIKIKRNIKELKILIENLCEKDFLIISEISSLISKTLRSGGCIFGAEMEVALLKVNTWQQN